MALAGAAGPLLAVRLAAAAADLAAGLRVMRAQVAARQLGGHDLVEDGRVDRGVEQLVAQLTLPTAAPVRSYRVVCAIVGLLHEDERLREPGRVP